MAKYFNPDFLSLTSSHPIFLTCGSSPYEVSKAVVQARFLSGRARVESLTKYWDMSNKDVVCLLGQSTNPLPGTIEHLLLAGGCPALVDARLSMISMFQAYMVPRAYLLSLFKELFGKNDNTMMQFLLDCSVLPSIIRLSQISEIPVLYDIFNLTRTYLFKLFVT